MTTVHITFLVIWFFISKLCYCQDTSGCTLESTASTWPDCFQQGVDWTGDDLLDGLRFSREACAEWCATKSSKCAGWVYKERGTWCHLKYIKGAERNLNSPLTEDDVKQIEADCKKNPPTTTAATTSAAASGSDNATSSGAGASADGSTNNSTDSSTSTASNLCDYTANETWYMNIKSFKNIVNIIDLIKPILLKR